jgi:hypothetical protein
MGPRGDTPDSQALWVRRISQHPRKIKGESSRIGALEYLRPVLPRVPHHGMQVLRRSQG